MTGQRRRLRRLLAGAAVVLAAATTAPLATAAPAAAAEIHTCTPSDSEGPVRVGDVPVVVCWYWKWISANPSTWRPTAFYLFQPGTRRLSIKLVTNNNLTPPFKDLGAKDGDASFGVPAGYKWNFESNINSTTTEIRRRVPGRTTDCVVRIRHDRHNIFELPKTGQCNLNDPV
jgi:hypothetical protein